MRIEDAIRQLQTIRDTYGMDVEVHVPSASQPGIKCQATAIWYDEQHVRTLGNNVPRIKPIVVIA